MKSRQLATICTAVAVLMMWTEITVSAAPMGTVFTYQGRLEDAGGTINDTCDFRFRLWDDLTLGTEQGTSPDDHFVVLVDDGLFNVDLDFGVGAFPGEARFLEMEVCCSTGCAPGGLVALAPRQELTAAPQAFRALNGVGGIDALNVDSSDYVGIGTTAVGANKLTVNHSTAGESAIFAEHTLANDYTPAIYAKHQDATTGRGIGIESLGGYIGVKGDASRTGSSEAFGVHARAWGGTGDTYGLFAEAAGAGINYGVFGIASGGTTDWAAYFPWGQSYFGDYVGIGTTTVGANKLTVNHSTAGESAIFAEHTLANDYTPAIYAKHQDATTGRGIGIESLGGYIGVKGDASRTGSSEAFGVHARAWGGTGDTYGLFAEAAGAGINYGVFGIASGGTADWAAYFPWGRSYFGDYVGIGTTAVGANKLTVNHATAGESAIFAEHTLANDYTPAIYAKHQDATTGRGIGIESLGGYIGVKGDASRTGSSEAFGVHARAWGGTGDTYGLFAEAAGAGINYGVFGIASGGTTDWAAYFPWGQSYFGDYVGIGTTTIGANKLEVRHATDAESVIKAVHVGVSATTTTAVRAEAVEATAVGGIGVYAQGGYKGMDVYSPSIADGTRYGIYVDVADGHGGSHYGVRSFTYGSATSYGLRGSAYSTASTAYGVYGYASGSPTSVGVYGSTGGGTTRWAGYFNGNVNVTGDLSKGTGSFKIDHPLDPENKYLYHSFVESPDMMNVYNGNIILDANGEATIEMAEWFGALNRDFRYQLTCVGSFAPVYVAEKINGNRFKVAGGKAGIEVSWQVTGIRQDPLANQNRIKVEVAKPENERGRYLYPRAYGKPRTMGVDYDEAQEEEMRSQEEEHKQQERLEAAEKSEYLPEHVALASESRTALPSAPGKEE